MVASFCLASEVFAAENYPRAYENKLSASELLQELQEFGSTISEYLQIWSKDYLGRPGGSEKFEIAERDVEIKMTKKIERWRGLGDRYQAWSWQGVKKGQAALQKLFMINSFVSWFVLSSKFDLYGSNNAYFLTGLVAEAGILAVLAGIYCVVSQLPQYMSVNRTTYERAKVLNPVATIIQTTVTALPVPVAKLDTILKTYDIREFSWEDLNAIETAAKKLTLKHCEDYILSVSNTR